MGAEDKPTSGPTLSKHISLVQGLLARRPWVLIGSLILAALLFYGPGSSSEEPEDLFASYRNDVTRSAVQHVMDTRPYPYEEKGPFFSYSVGGYDNTGNPGGEFVGSNLSCSALSERSEIGVQKPWDVSDNMHQIAEELDDHPMVYYTQKVFGATPGTFQLKSVVDASWDRLAGSCILLKDKDVFLCITRIIFHDDARKDHCQISFLRGQIFSKSWVHLENYSIHWKGREIVFPTIFDTDTDFAEGGDVYGPEDPRIIIEEGVDGAEPVIIFNMISEKATWKRAMWLFRPFSQHSTILTIEGRERLDKEKNWAPFFVDERDTSVKHARIEPSRFIHFVYNFAPLEILKCNLIDGMCQQAFLQEVPGDMKSTHDREWSELRGGTQWVPIPLPQKAKDHRLMHKGHKSTHNLQAFLSFPRTHTEQTTFCEIAVYRPELTIMVTNGKDFFLSYVSGPMDFGVGTLIDEPAFSDPCKTGRIMILNSIADWDFNARTAYSDKTDVMTLAVTVNDATVQAMRLSGILKLIYGLPSFQQLVNNPELAFGNGIEAEDYHNDHFTRYSATALDVRECAEEEARSYIDQHTSAESKKTIKQDRETKRIEEEKRLEELRNQEELHRAQELLKSDEIRRAEELLREEEARKAEESRRLVEETKHDDK